MLIINILILLIVFLVASIASGWLLHHYGYPPPAQLKTREDWILLAMKITLFMLLVIIQIVMLLMLEINPLDLDSGG